MRYLVDRARLTYGRTLAAVLQRTLGRAAPHSLQRIGTDYGGWYCVPALMRPGDTAICCGAGEDISFDVALNARYGMRVLCVDPTARAVQHVRAVLRAQQSNRPMLIEAGPLTYDLAGFDPQRFASSSSSAPSGPRMASCSCSRPATPRT